MNHPEKNPPADPASAIAGLDMLRSTGRKRPPVEQWDPAQVREIAMHIAADGTWCYLGSPINRPAMVRLFASILRLEPDGRHALVTPVEKCLITVEDAPFVAVQMAVTGTGNSRKITFTTNLGDEVTAGPGHPLAFRLLGDAQVPYVDVRGGLLARVNRALYYDLMDLAELNNDDAGDMIGIWSAGTFWPVGEVPPGSATGTEQ